MQSKFNDGNPMRSIKKTYKNRHRLDEMPKNHPSKLVQMHCGAVVDWLQDATYCGGHKRQRYGHRQVSGLVRANLKQECRKLVEEQLME